MAILLQVLGALMVVVAVAAIVGWQAGLLVAGVVVFAVIPEPSE